MRCQVCGTSEQHEGTECDYCGATVRSVLGKGMPLPPGIRDDIGATREEKRKAAAAKRKERLLWHTAAGAIILFAVCVLVNVVSFLFAPRMMAYGILISIPIALVFGPPIGLVTSWLNWGPVGGAVIGSVFFAAGIYLGGSMSPLASILAGALPGLVVGGFIGVHVRSDRE